MDGQEEIGSEMVLGDPTLGDGVRKSDLGVLEMCWCSVSSPISATSRVTNVQV